MADKATGGKITIISKNYSERAEQVRWSTSKEDIKLYSGQNITAYGADGGVRFSVNDRVDIQQKEQADFTISLKQGEEKTFVPLGIPDGDGNMENPFLFFEYTVKGAPIDSLLFQILDEEGSELYSTTGLSSLVIRSSNKKVLINEFRKSFEGFRKEPDEEKRQKLVGQWNPTDTLKAFLEPDHLRPGSYALLWDGFSNQGIYESIRFNSKQLTARLTASGKGISRKAELQFMPGYAKADWADIKIDKNAKRIDATLRVFLEDGGTEGLSCHAYTAKEDEPITGTKMQICDWHKVPQIQRDIQAPLISRGKTFDELKQLTLEGLIYYWGRNPTRKYGKSVHINGSEWGFYVNAVESPNHRIETPKIYYMTNEAAPRSRNWEGSRKLFYLDGYIQLEINGHLTWIWVNDLQLQSSNASIFEIYYSYRSEDFKLTAAHEIGHEILLAYGGHTYSKKHKETSGWLQEITDTNGYPNNGEIDLMKYAMGDRPYDYNNKTFTTFFERNVAAERDVLGLIWCSRLVTRHAITSKNDSNIS